MIAAAAPLCAFPEAIAKEYEESRPSLLGTKKLPAQGDTGRLTGPRFEGPSQGTKLQCTELHEESIVHESGRLHLIAGLEVALAEPMKSRFRHKVASLATS